MYDDGQLTYGAIVSVTLTTKLHVDDLLTLSNVMHDTVVGPRLKLAPDDAEHDLFWIPELSDAVYVKVTGM